MTHDEHMALYRDHREKATALLLEFINTPGDTRWETYEQYKAEDKQANKHFGIAQGILTRHINKTRSWRTGRRDLESE